MNAFFIFIKACSFGYYGPKCELKFVGHCKESVTCNPPVVCVTTDAMVIGLNQTIPKVS